MCLNTVSCPLCLQSSFSNIDTLRHSLVKATSGPVTCPICNDTLLGLDKLTIHLFSHTNSLLSNPSDLSHIPFNEQPAINEVVSGNSLSTPNESIEILTLQLAETAEPATTSPTVMQNSCNNQIKCDICGLSFRSGDLLRMHNKLMHRVSDEIIGTGISDIQYQCHLCAKVFKMKGSLRVHLKVVHTIGLQTNKDGAKLNICQKIRNATNQQINGIPAASQAPEIEQTDTIPLNNMCNKNMTDDELSAASKVNKTNSVGNGSKTPEASKIWECDICSKSFTTKYFLKKHKRLHTGEMPYTCSICGKTFTFQQSYHKHLLYHNDEKPHVCQTCGRAFKELSTLHNHERIHSGEKPFKCEICGKCFRQRVSYLVHKRIHTGAMPYKCTSCDKSFRYKVSQRTHKCAVQPPGTVILQGGDLLEKLLQTTSLISAQNGEDILAELTIGQHITEISEVELLRNDCHDELIKSIDEIVSESCDRMGIENVQCQGNEVETNINRTNENPSKGRTPSPSEKLEHLCLYSPTSTTINSSLDKFCEEALQTILNQT